MQSKTVSFLLVFMLSVCCFTCADAIDIRPAQPDTATVVIIEDTLLSPFVQFSQIAIGFSQRLDNTQMIDHSPMILAKYYFHVSDKLVGKAGVGYNSSSNFKSIIRETIEYRVIELEVGTRWNILNKNISLYHENGFEYNHYREPLSGIWEQRIGLNFSFGINFHVERNLELDISVAKTFNNPDFSKTNYSSLSNSPIGLRDNVFFKEVFNPLTIQILLFRKL